MGEEIMKFKKIMLVTLMLLAIIAIGAVSAADNLTDTPASDQLEISGDDAIISNDGLMGNKFIKIEPGKDSEILKDGDEITKTKDFKTLEDMVGEIIFMVTDNGEKK